MSSISYTERPNKTLPKGAKVISKRINISVEEIENGFIISKSEDIDYKLSGNEDIKYFYNNTKMFSKDNPIDKKLLGSKNLADSFK